MAPSTTNSLSQKYPYQSTLNVENFVSIKLTQTLLWKTQIMGLVESQDMLGLIDDTCSMPEQFLPASSAEGASRASQSVNPEYVAWRRSDRLLWGWITGTLSEEILGMVVGLDTATEVWKTLEDSFARDSQERKFYLSQKLHMNRNKGTSSINDYICSFKEICDELAAIGKPVNDRNKVFAFLNGLAPGYESFVTTMMKPPILSYKEIVPLLQSHDTIKNLHSTEGYGIPSHNVAFVGQYQSGNKKNKQRLEFFNSKGRGFA